MITINYTVTREDMSEAEAASGSSVWRKVFSVVILGALGILFLHEPIRLFRGWQLFWKYWPVNLILLGIGFGLLWLASGLVGLQRLLRQNADFREVQFSGDMIAITTRHKQQTIRWRRDLDWIETDNLFLLPIQGSETRLLVPKRAFTQEQLQSFRNLRRTPQPDVRFTINFFLTEEDFKHASSATKPWIATTAGLVAARIVCGGCAIFFLLAPSLGVFSDVRGGWTGMWKTNPAIAIGLATFCLLELWVASGPVGLRSLERYLNHYNQRRIYTFGDGGISITRGARTTYRRWKHLLDFRETEKAFVLRTNFVACYIIPKTALAPDKVQEFQSFLAMKLPTA